MIEVMPLLSRDFEFLSKTSGLVLCWFGETTTAWHGGGVGLVRGRRLVAVLCFFSFLACESGVCTYLPGEFQLVFCF